VLCEAVVASPGLPEADGMLPAGLVVVEDPGLEPAPKLEAPPAPPPALPPAALPPALDPPEPPPPPPACPHAAPIEALARKPIRISVEVVLRRVVLRDLQLS
jgi:hypothetical protein